MNPADFAPQPQPPPLPRFTLSPVALGVLGACGSFHVLAFLPRIWTAPQLAVQDVGIFALGFLLALGLARLAWQLDPHRRAGNLVFCSLLALFALARGLEAFALAAPLLRRPTVQAVDPRATSRKVRAVTDRVMRDFGEKLAAYNRASADLKAAGMIDPTGLDSREAIARRRALVKSYGSANEAFTEACRTLEPTLLGELARAVPAKEARQGTAAVIVGFDMPLVLRIRDCERRATLLLDGVLNIYDVEFPRWHADAAHRVVFDDPAAATREHRWGQQLLEITSEERAIQRERDACKAARLAATASPRSAAAANPASASARRE